MAFNQDDARERMMRGATNLKKEGDGRYGEDGDPDVALGGREHRLLFELKIGAAGRGLWHR